MHGEVGLINCKICEKPFKGNLFQLRKHESECSKYFMRREANANDMRNLDLKNTVNEKSMNVSCKEMTKNVVKFLADNTV